MNMVLEALLSSQAMIRNVNKLVHFLFQLVKIVS